MPTPDVLMDNLAFVGKQMEDMAVNKHATPYERTIACALEVTIANLLEIFKQASMSWPARIEIVKPLAANLQPGDVIRFRACWPQVIKERKADDSGWWITDGTGLADSAFDTDFGWRIVSRVEVSR